MILLYVLGYYLRKSMKFLSIALSLLAFINLSSMELPDEFFIKQRFFNIPTTFDIKTDTEKLFIIESEIFSLLPQYYLKDTSQNLIATSRMHFFPFLARFDLMDNENNFLGTVEQDLTFVYPHYSFFSATRKKLATAKMNFWDTKLTIKDGRDEHIIAILSRPYFHIINKWTVKILDPLAIGEKGIHPHAFMTLIAYQVHCDRRKNVEMLDTSVEIIKIIDRIDLSVKKEECEQFLDNYRSLYEEAEPTQADFDYIESLDVSYENIEVLFDSDELTVEQKRALWLMLENLLSKD